MNDALSPIACIGALYAGSERGLAADALAARSLGLAPHTVCTAIVAASHDHVTDLTEVPSDTVRSQLEHLDTVGAVAGARIGVLGSAANANAVLEWASHFGGPVVLEAVASGPNGETVLPSRGIGVLTERFSVADLVVVSRQDAELFSGGEINSLDDAQVAAQRLSKRGAKRVLIHCGVLPTRFFDAALDPGADSSPDALAADLYFDGEDFALFEIPSQEAVEGVQSLYAITALSALMNGLPPEAVLQAATRQSVEATRAAYPSADGRPRLAFDWARSRAGSP